MKTLNDWETKKIIHKSKIFNFEILEGKNCLKELKDEYFCLIEPVDVCESYILEDLNGKLANELNIEDTDLEIKNFIKQLNKYNELKDIGETLVHKLAVRNDKQTNVY